MAKFAKIYTVESMIANVKEKNKEVSKLILDFLIILVENKDFRNLFIFLEGHVMIVK